MDNDSLRRNNNVSIREYKELQGTIGIEGILCLATLITSKTLQPDATVKDAEDYYLHTVKYCNYCSLHDVCLACIINR